MQQPTTPTRTKKLERLLEFNLMLTQNTELETLLQAISNYICELTLSEAGSVLTFEIDTGLLKFAAVPRAHANLLKGVRIPIEKSIAGQVFTTGRPVVVYDAPTNPNLYRDVDHTLKFQTLSVAAVPVQFGGQRLGVIEAVNKIGGGHYTQEDLSILESLAAFAGIALNTYALQEQLSRHAQALGQVERKKSDFVAIASHELRTPLGVILGHASMLKETAADPETSAQFETILKNALYLNEIVEKITATIAEPTGQTMVQKMPVSIGSLISEVITAYAEAAKKKHINLTSQLPMEELQVPGDAEKLALVLSSLIENALKFTESGGSIKIKAENQPGFVKVSVIDTGIGIPVKDLPRIFDRFYQVESHTTRRTGGLGLGLSVARVMIELHEGQIWAESVEGRGSKFSFLLPTT